MAQPDYSLLNVGRTQGFNTPFENLSQVMQVRNQQLAAQSLAEQRDSVADQRRQQTEKIAQENRRIAGASKALQAGGGVRDLVLKSALENDPESVPGLTEFFDKTAASAATAKKLRQEAKDHEAEFLADVAMEIKKRGSTPEVLKLGTDWALEQNPDYEEGIKRIQAHMQGAAPEQVNAFLDHVISLAPSRRQKPQQKPMSISPGTGVLNEQTGAYEVPLPKEVTPPKADSFDAYLPMYLKERGIPPQAVTTGITDAARRKYEAAQRAPQQAQSDNEPLVAIMGPDGKPVLVRRSQAEGKTPASNREQGRPVTSGDAGKIGDIDEALKLAKGLSFKRGDTGIMPWLGSQAPDAVTNLTGFGLEAKQRQGVINLVKQIIGKGLEGGVLRKEDEYKYEKILPTLSDPEEVVKSKIENMVTTMEQKRSTHLDALTDAGYDTGRFMERGAPKATTGAAGVESPAHITWRLTGKQGPEPK